MLIILAPLFLCWGSFLNVVAYRLVSTDSFSLITSSRCPNCAAQIAWYDLVPIISFIVLNGSCRTCAYQISWLYPFIELITLISLSALWILQPHHYFFGYALLFSALIVTIRTDLQTMLISPFVTLGLVPAGIAFGYLGLLPIGWLESFIGAAVGFFLLFSIAKLFSFFTKKEGIGAGDFDLLALIGSFTGPVGVWFTLLVSSTLGSIVGIILLTLTKRDRSAPIPFGPFLAFAAIVYVLFQDVISTSLASF